MWNVCWRCGVYRADKVIDPAGPTAICPDCGHRHPFRQLPLLLVSGASGTGKSTICQSLLGRLSAVVVLDADILWRPEFDSPAQNYQGFFDTWLRLCKNIGQAGRPVVLFGAGFGVPANLEVCIERRFFAGLHYLALTCADDVLVQRLRDRPAWRKSNAPGFITEQLQFNNWFKAQSRAAAPALELLDTTIAPTAVTVEQVIAWINARSHT